jgi:hypothetical protein
MLAKNGDSCGNGDIRPDHGFTPSGSSSLVWYALVAVLARTADAGAVVAIVLLVASQSDSATTAGFLAACVTAPPSLVRSSPAELICRRMADG